MEETDRRCLWRMASALDEIGKNAYVDMGTLMRFLDTTSSAAGEMTGNRISIFTRLICQSKASTRRFYRRKTGDVELDRGRSIDHFVRHVPAADVRMALCDYYTAPRVGSNPATDYNTKHVFLVILVAGARRGDGARLLIWDSNYAAAKAARDRIERERERARQTNRETASYCWSVRPVWEPPEAIIPAGDARLLRPTGERLRDAIVDANNAGLAGRYIDGLGKGPVLSGGRFRWTWVREKRVPDADCFFGPARGIMRRFRERAEGSRWGMQVKPGEIWYGGEGNTGRGHCLSLTLRMLVDLVRPGSGQLHRNMGEGDLRRLGFERTWRSTY